MSVLFVGLLVLAAVLSLGVDSSVAGYYGSDAAGRGMTQAFALLGAVALWLVLSILVAVCGARGGLPGRAKIIAAALVAVATAGQVISFAMLNRLSHGEHPELVLRIVVGVSPWLVIAGCLGTLAPDLRGVQAGAAAVLACLSLVPMAVWRPVRQQRIEQQSAVLQEREDYQSKLDAIARMPDDTPVETLLAFTDIPEMFTTRMPEAARARIRTLPAKQAELEALLAKGSDLVLVQLNTFDLEVTPALCSAARQNFARIARQWQQPAAVLQPAPDRLVGPIRYLLRRGCQCDPELDALQQALGHAPDSFEKEQFLTSLQRLRASGGVK